MAIDSKDNSALDRRDDRKAAGEDQNGKAQEPWSVEQVVEGIPGGPPQTDSSSPVPFFHMLERLKTTKREGWRRFGIAHGESISDHMYRMAMITMFAPPALAAKINVPHCTKMALVHDMAEALVGDITPVDGIPKPEKNRRESTTMDYFTNSLLGRVNGGMTGKQIRDVWQEYEDNETMNAKFVHDVDKIELILQMVEYERVHETKLDLGEFTWVATRIELAEVKAWSDDLMEEREVFWGDKKHTRFDTEEALKAATAKEVDTEKLVKEHVGYYGDGKSTFQ
ncbi:HD-domain/PDEase-like protein [Glarea lozoyensis ATCC 20868]|uniref:5'-deoxynucleotidase n=2 Tax=Glarea lozoyensis TaxID=101852 RepID=S3DY42_GLAL2|nr:HD-domain/PDEase-like protein [Glarea lozoyensis ATCC 20868]EHK96544.1 putative HD domain-containing protein C4G3.17 [Glarea lozoyensis 74030]EPE31263.1 HD-domain/PDEase-like protein [Glarea lozoyensis ATCC 20868]